MRRGDEPRQPAADDHDWERMSDNGRVMKGHTPITFDVRKTLHAFALARFGEASQGG
jgi:hypothetical protein